MSWQPPPPAPPGPQATPPGPQATPPGPQATPPVPQPSNWYPSPPPSSPSPRRANAGHLVLAVVLWLVTALTCPVVLLAWVSNVNFGLDPSAPPPPPRGSPEEAAETANLFAHLVAVIGTFCAGFAALALMITAIATKRRGPVWAEAIIAAICVVVALIAVANA